MAESEDVNTLKRRGRRRLVGAIALVLVAVIVLPMVFDSEPKVSAPPVSVRIPGEEETGFVPKVTPKGAESATTPAPAAAAGAQKAAPPVAEQTAEKAPDKAPAQAAPVAVEKPAPKVESVVTKAPVAPSPAATAAEQFMVPAGAYAEPAGVIGKLKAAKIPYYTEPIATKQGTVIRVRAGPFASREAAEKALRRLKELGLKPGNVTVRS